MELHNSLVDYYINLYCSLFGDIATRLNGSVDCSGFDQDMKTIRSRCQREGLGFLTKTLPSLGKAFDKALSTGTQLDHLGFKKEFSYLSETGIPLFMGSLFKHVLDTDGNLMWGPGTVHHGEKVPALVVEVVRSIRQVCFLLYKLKLPYTNEQEHDVLDSFRNTDSCLSSQYEKGTQTSEARAVIRVARALVTRVTCSFDPYAINPRHGPGVVATGEKPWEKKHFKRFYSKIDEVYPYGEYFFYSVSHLADELDSLATMDAPEQGVAKVVLVPKDSRGPRLISCEPLEFQWMQQGLSRVLVEHLESHPWTSGRVNFTNQEINRGLALAGSATGRYVTLDMKEASDRVSVDLVKDLFPEPLVSCLMALRTDATRLPDGDIVSLNKFAPMGSALCFPVEALCFWALAVAIVHRHRKPYSLYQAARSVYVYGDDIIVDREDYAVILQQMPWFGLAFNPGKCCTDGLFRESCGCDAFAGVDVTPLKMRSVWLSGRTEIAQSYASYYAWLIEHDYLEVAAYLRKTFEAQYFALPTSAYKNANFLNWYDPHGNTYGYNRERFRLRVNRKLHRLEIYAHRTRAALEKRRAHDWSSFLEFHSRQPGDYGQEGEPAGTYAVPHRSYLQRGWSHFAY